jgi:arsenite methyltransferase
MSSVFETLKLNPEATYSDVQKYYGHVLANKNDLKTTACCATATPPSYIRSALAKVPLEVQEKFYGCGLPFPMKLEGTTVLDLGSGTGRDCFVLSQLVGEKGRVIGIDMTPNQIEVAKKHNVNFASSLGWKQSNIDFRQGFIENLAAADIADNSVDVVISNCVVNLSPRKDLVLKEIFRVLKPGGELYFSDVYCDRRLSKENQTDPVILGECLGGALYWQDFRRLMNATGFLDFRTVARNPVDVTDAAIQKKLGQARFESITVRAFKIPLEDTCEDYGQTAKYLGNIPNSETSFLLDDHHEFVAGKFMSVCKNTADMLKNSRYSASFEVLGNEEKHFGIFPCAPESPSSASNSSSNCCV